MKRASLSTAALVLGALVITLALGATDSQPKRLISGEVVSLFAFLAQGLRGADHRDAALFQVETRGLPIAIVEDGTGDIYVAVYKGPTSAVSKLAPYVGLGVNAQGPVWEKGGLKLIEVEVVAEQ